jgi:ParB family chromosome partitioning protein
LISIRPQRYGQRDIIESSAVRSLADSLASVGQLSPITVIQEADHYRLVAGRCRCEAAKLLGWEYIDAIIRAADDRGEAAAAMAENLARNNLRPCEEARLLKQAMDGTGSTYVDLARGIGRSEPWVRERLHLLDWPPEFQAAADEGVLSLHALRKLLQVEDVDYRHTLLMVAIRNGATGNQVERWVADWRLNALPRPDDELHEISRAPSIAETEVRQRCIMCENMVPALDIDFVALCRPCGHELIKAKQGVV